MNFKNTIMSLVMICLSDQSFADVSVTDSGKLYPTNVSQRLYPTSVQAIQNIVLQAKNENKNISIAGAKYSQGGQTNGTNSINIDLSRFNKLIKIDTVNKTVTVQSGMTWEQLQNILHPLNLSIKVMQASNVFSIGGSASVNVHGRDPHYGPIIETIISCTIINPSGEIQYLSRTENPELFSLVIGGYGLFGVMVSVELSVTDNPLCYKQQEAISYKKYITHLQSNILNNPDINLYYARLNAVPGNSFLTEVINSSYLVDKKASQTDTSPLRNETAIAFNRWLFDLYRNHYGKTIGWIRYLVEKNHTPAWENETLTCRNQLMRPYILCLENQHENSTDLLQEYFIPAAKFIQFTDKLREASQDHSIKLLNVTLRWTPSNTESFLSYAQSDTIAFVLYFTTDLDDTSLNNVKKYSKKLIDACLKCKGTFYLPYQQFATSQQIHTSYPMMKHFIKQKQIYDPQGIFTNNWYQNYLLNL